MKRRNFLKGMLAIPAVALLLPGSSVGSEQSTNNRGVAGSSPAPATNWFDHHDTDIHAKPVRSVEANGCQSIYVLAGNYAEATDWMRSHGLLGTGAARYVSDYRKLQGVARGMKFVRVGTWHQRSDRATIVQMLISREAVEVSPITGDFAWYVQGDKSWRGRGPRV